MRRCHAAHKCFSLKYKDFYKKATMSRIFLVNDVWRNLLKGDMSFKTRAPLRASSCNSLIVAMFVLYYLAGAVLSQGISATNTGEEIIVMDNLQIFR